MLIGTVASPKILWKPCLRLSAISPKEAKSLHAEPKRRIFCHWVVEGTPTSTGVVVFFGRLGESVPIQKLTVLTLPCNEGRQADYAQKNAILEYILSHGCQPPLSDVRSLGYIKEQRILNT